MKRNLLIEAVRQTAGGLGYAFHTGPETVIPARLGSAPAVWLLPPRLTSAEGRRECRTTYSITLYFVAALTPTLKNDAEPALHTLEQAALEMFHGLAARTDIVRTYGLKSAPLKKALTRNGEIASEVEMSVEMFYCR